MNLPIPKPISFLSPTLVLGYKGKSGAVPQKVLVYCLFWVSPDFFPHTKKLVQTAFAWVKTLVTLYGCRPTYGIIPPEYIDRCFQGRFFFF